MPEQSPRSYEPGSLVTSFEEAVAFTSQRVNQALQNGVPIMLTGGQVTQLNFEEGIRALQREAQADFQPGDVVSSFFTKLAAIDAQRSEDPNAGVVQDLALSYLDARGAFIPSHIKRQSQGNRYKALGRTTTYR